MGLFGELKRRNVFRVAVAYAIMAWLVAQIADVVLGNIGVPEWVMPAMFFVMGIGFIAAVIIAWAYEITPEGIKREAEVDRDDSITHLTAKKLDYITIAAVLGVLVMFVIQQDDDSDRPIVERQRTVDSGNAERDLRSIAVLPFANRSNLDEDLFFTDGIHDDLLTQLAKINDLKVISRTSVMKYRDDPDAQIPEIAQELGVATILEGGVQRAGTRIRINAQLIDVATDEHLWAETFDSEMTLDNLFEIQTEITTQIVEAVRGELTAEEQQSLASAPTQNLEAYEAYLQSRAIWDATGYSVGAVRDAEPYARLAVALDPDFALAQLLVAEIDGMMHWMGIDQSESRRKDAETAIAAAAQLLPEDSPDLLAARGEFLYRFDGNFRGALTYQQRAHEAEPGNTVILSQLAVTQRRVGLFEESLRNLQELMRRDPGNVSTAVIYADSLGLLNRWERLQEDLPPLMDRFGDDPTMALVDVYSTVLGQGDVAGAREKFDKVTPVLANNYVFMATFLPWYERDFDAAAAAWDLPVVSEVVSTSAGWKGWPEVNQAMVAEFTGDDDKAWGLLESVVKGLDEFDRAREANVVSSELGAIAWAFAMMGDCETGVSLVEEATQIHTLENDPLSGNGPRFNMAWILARCGEREQALDLIEALLDQPSGMSRWDLKLNPQWDFMRDNERFNELARPRSRNRQVAPI